MSYGDITCIILLIVTLAIATWTLLTTKEIKRLMATQEEQLREALGLLTTTVAPGVTEIIKRLNEITVPTDNPALQDEIDGVKQAARTMATEIDAVLNPPTPDTGEPV